jgi:hypothetical protein
MISEPASFQLHSLMMTVQGCADADFAISFAVNGDVIPEKTFVRTRNDMGGSSGAVIPGEVPPVLLESLRTLSYRMAEALEKPDNVLDLFATLSAINALIECSSLTYAFDNVDAV